MTYGREAAADDDHGGSREALRPFDSARLWQADVAKPLRSGPVAGRRSYVRTGNQPEFTFRLLTRHRHGHCNVHLPEKSATEENYPRAIDYPIPNGAATSLGYGPRTDYPKAVDDIRKWLVARRTDKTGAPSRAHQLFRTTQAPPTAWRRLQSFLASARVCAGNRTR